MVIYIVVFFLIIVTLLIKLITRVHKQTFTCVNRKKMIIKGDKIIKPITSKKTYYKIKKVYNNYLHKFDFVPRMEFNDAKYEITEDYYKHQLSKKNKPKNYVAQLTKIYDTFKKNNLYHNDINPKHLYCKNNKIYIIDFDTMRKYKLTYMNRWNNSLEDIIKKYK